MKRIKTFGLGLMLLFGLPGFAQVNIIFDTDLGGDVDDLGALAMLHHFVDKGECNLLGVMCWSTEKYAVSAIDAVNRYYKHPDIPIGKREGENHYTEWCYSKPIADQFAHELTQEKAEEVTRLYRKILSEAKNKSITIVTVGPLKNIENLINSPKDDISRLSGKKLLKKKVKEFVVMGGQFPSGENEWNFNGDMEGVTKRVFQDLETPVTFLGFELGDAIKTGLVLKERAKDNPLYVGWLHFSNNAPWMTELKTGDIIDNSTFDQTAILYAVRGGVGEYWERLGPGRCIPDEKGGNQWEMSKKGKHSYLKLIQDPERLASMIESIMLGEF